MGPANAGARAPRIIMSYWSPTLATSSPDQRVMSPSQAQVNERHKHKLSRSSEDQVNIDFRHCGTLNRSVPQCGGVIEIRLLVSIAIFGKSVTIFGSGQS